MPQFHARKLDIETPPVANFLHDRGNFSFPQQLRGKNEGYQVQERLNSVSPISSVTFFTLMLALHVLQNSLRGMAMKNSVLGVKTSKPVKAATKGNGDPRSVAFDDEQQESMMSHPRGPELSIFNHQSFKRKYFHKDSSLDSKHKFKFETNMEFKPIAEASTVVAKKPTLGLNPNWITEPTILPISSTHKGGGTMISKVKRSLASRERDPLPTIQLPHIPFPIKKKIKKKKKDPVLGSIEGLFWTILTHFLGVFVKYIKVVRDGFFPKILKVFFPQWLVDKEPVQ